jgi:hypothetical protein
MSRAAIFALVLSLGGCATIQEHPYATSFAVAFVPGSIAASQRHDFRESAVAHPPGTATIGTRNRSTGACQ